MYIMYRGSEMSVYNMSRVAMRREVYRRLKVQSVQSNMSISDYVYRLLELEGLAHPVQNVQKVLPEKPLKPAHPVQNVQSDEAPQFTEEDFTLTEEDILQLERTEKEAAEWERNRREKADAARAAEAAERPPAGVIEEQLRRHALTPEEHAEAARRNAEEIATWGSDDTEA
jgi:hypothetical protein